MFPVSDVIPSRTTPFITVSLIVLNLLAFFYQLQLTRPELQLFVQTFGVVPAYFNVPSLFTSMLVGNILAVSWEEVWRTAALYAVIGAFHWIFRKKFLAISMNHDAAEGSVPSLRLWDFLFYASFGFVVTRSVAIAGVLLVFCYLIVPSVAAMLFSDRIGPRLAIGWTMGTVVSAVGVYLSLMLDLPTGATIVCTFGVVLILMSTRTNARMSLSVPALRAAST